MPRMENSSLESEHEVSKFDDDGNVKRTGTLMTATAHIITAVIGSGVLSLAWATAQLGWIAGPFALLAFAVITWFTSTLLADCYRSPDPVTGRRGYTYMEVVKANLGGRKFQLCGIAQYINQCGGTIGYTITSSISMVAIKRSNCFHNHHTHEGCHAKNNTFIIIFGMIQIILSQLPNFHKIWWLSIVAAIMSFGYSTIGLGLSIAQITGGARPEKSLTGIPLGKDMSTADKMWNNFAALGDIAFAYSFALVLVEIQDTLKSSPPKNQVMKKAASIGISIATLFYTLCGVLGYAAFGNKVPGNILTGFGFFEPFWLVDLANVFIIIHLVGAYQVFAQPLFGFLETWCKRRWPESTFITKENLIEVPGFGVFSLNLFRLIWRTIYVMFTTLIAMAFPNFNNVLGLIGATVFWPLTLYFPIEICIARSRIHKFSLSWIWMEILSFICLIVSLMAAAGSIHGIIKNMSTFKPFKSES